MYLIIVHVIWLSWCPVRKLPLCFICPPPYTIIWLVATNPDLWQPIISCIIRWRGQHSYSFSCFSGWMKTGQFWFVIISAVIFCKMPIMPLLTLSQPQNFITVALVFSEICCTVSFWNFGWRWLWPISINRLFANKWMCSVTAKELFAIILKYHRLDKIYLRNIFVQENNLWHKTYHDSSFQKPEI